MVYLYGDVPYVDKIQDQFRIDFTRTPKEEVIAHMVEDLQFAVENLPTDPDAVKVGKLTKWAAEHLLSEVYLMQGDYAKAETAAENVINSGYFHLMEDRFGEKAKANGDVFSDLFVENNQNRTSGNMESIWVMQFEYNTTGGGTNSDDWTRRAWEPKYFEITGFVLADSLGGRGLSQLVPMNGGLEKIPVSLMKKTFVIPNTTSNVTGITTTRTCPTFMVKKPRLQTKHGLPPSVFIRL